MAIPKERDIMRTNGLNDVELAIMFHDDFSKDDKFIGKIITNEQFNEWIFGLNFPSMGHGWETPEGQAAWNGYRRYVRDYIKNGVMTEEYASKEGYHPYSVDINRHGIDLVIHHFSDTIIDSARELAKKRQKTVRNQSKTLEKGFDTLINIYRVDGVEVQMQRKLVQSHNQLRLYMENAFDEMFKKTVADTLEIIEDSKRVTRRIEQITKGMEDSFFDDDI